MAWSASSESGWTFGASRRTRALLGSLLLACTSAQAGLFDDEEARKAIIDLRAKVELLDKAQKSSVTEAATGQKQIALLEEQLSAMRRSILDLNNQIEIVRTDLAKLRGSDEQAGRGLSEIQQRQRDLTQNLDERLRRLEPVKVVLEGKEVEVLPAEKRDFEAAIATIRGGGFDQAVAQLLRFQRRYPGSQYEDMVRFWYGNALYGKRDYKGAIEVFRAFVAAASDHPRAPEAVLALANSQAETKDPKGARKTLEDLIKAYPQSEAAQAARERLPSLR